jgi:hypothetical protein
MKNVSENKMELTAPENKQLAVIITADIESGELPDLDDAVEYPVDLLSEYWTPIATGERKNLYFAKIDARTVIDDKNEIKELVTAYFIEKKNGVAKSVSNASKRLVGALQDANVKPGMAVSITYLGKQRNKTNSFSSDNWSVKPLMIKSC